MKKERIGEWFQHNKQTNQTFDQQVIKPDPKS